MHVDVLALGDVGDRLADVLAVFDHGVARLDVVERDLVADRHVHLRRQLKDELLAVTTPTSCRAGLQSFDHDDADGVLLVVHQKLRNAHGAPLPPDFDLALVFDKT